MAFLSMNIAATYSAHKSNPPGQAIGALDSSQSSSFPVEKGVPSRVWPGTRLGAPTVPWRTFSTQASPAVAQMLRPGNSKAGPPLDEGRDATIPSLSLNLSLALSV